MYIKTLDKIKSIITPEEIALINRFRYDAIYREMEDRAEITLPNADELMCSAEDFLYPWYSKKSEFLFDKFGDKLMVEFPVSIPMDEAAIMDHMDANMRDCGTYEKLKYYNVFRRRPRRYGDADWEIPLYDIMDTENLAHKVLRDDFIWDYDKNIPPIKFQRGTRITKVIKAFNKKYHIISDEELEDFFINLSGYFNQKLEGTYVLSIHPLDYITMSENDCGWSSCMNWTETGCYRRGTIEMMNSPCVVVGYLKSNNSSYWYGPYKWNNKKWRCLFIVDRNFVSSVKGYPYQSSALVKLGLDKLREMVGLSTHATYRTIESTILENVLPEEEGKEIRFRTDAMYNDFGCDTTSYVYINPIDEWVGSFKGYRRYYYSGPQECIFCGEVTNQFLEDDYSEANSRLICDECINAGY